MIDRGSNRWSNARHTDLANASSSKLIKNEVGIIEEGDVNLGRVCVCRYDIVGETVVDGASKALIDVSSNSAMPIPMTTAPSI